LPRQAEGEFALVGEHLAKAISRPTDPVRWGSAMTDLDFHIMCAEAAADTGDPAGLAEHAPAAEVGAERLGHRLYTGIAHRTQGVALLLAGRPAEAVDRHSRALEVFAGLGTRWQLGRAFVARAEAHGAGRDFAAARADYTRALEAFEAVGAQPDAERTRQTIQHLT
jgi:hypothetical protein